MGKQGWGVISKRQVEENRGLLDTGLSWKTWKVRWTCMDLGNFSLIAEGLMMCSISYGPV